MPPTQPDPNYGAARVRFPTKGRIFAVDLVADTLTRIDFEELGYVGRWVELAAVGNDVEFYWVSQNDKASPGTPDSTARDTLDATSGKITTKDPLVAEQLANGADPEAGFVSADAPVLVVYSVGVAAVLRFKDVQV